MSRKNRLGAAMLEDELREAEGLEPLDREEVIDEPEPVAAAPEPAPVAAPATPAMMMTPADLQNIITAAVQAAVSGQASAQIGIADAVTQGLKNARTPIPENTDADNPRFSAYNPLGERAHPKPKLKAELFWGTRDKDGKVHPTYEAANHKTTSIWEIVAVNLLEPGNYKLRMLDNAVRTLAIVPTYNDADGSLTRLVLVLPTEVMAKGSQIKNTIPPLCEIVRQLTGHDIAGLSMEALAGVMAEHRAGRYVAVAA